MSNRAFGVEIECYAPDGDYDEWNEGGDGLDYTDDLLRKNGYSAWANLTTTDESLDYESYGVEVKSPPLLGDEGFVELRNVMSLLNENGFDVASDCGLHVHIDCPDFVGNSKLIVKTVKAWMRNQELINNMVSDNRLNNNYCAPWNEANVYDLEDYLQSYETADGTHRGAINVGALGYHGTIEIRQHEGTLNYEEAESWIKFCQAFIDSMTGTTVQKLGTEEMLLRRLKVERNASRFLTTKARINKERRDRESLI